MLQQAKPANQHRSSQLDCGSTTRADLQALGNCHCSFLHDYHQFLEQIDLQPTKESKMMCKHCVLHSVSGRAALSLHLALTGRAHAQLDFAVHFAVMPLTLTGGMAFRFAFADLKRAIGDLSRDAEKDPDLAQDSYLAFPGEEI
jgi:hypothetical protein